jgi:hypothetical protein
MLTQGYHFLKDRVDYLRHRGSTPKSVKSSDLYIVEYPKSGITWFSSIMASCFMQQAGIAIRPSYFNLEQFVCDIHINRDIPDNVNFPYYRVIKSHAGFNPFYRHMIYLVRNPFSVMNSYHNYLCAQQRFDGDLSAFARSHRHGIDSWVRHVDSWLNPKREMKLHLLRYEDLKDDAFPVMRTLFDNLGLVIADEIINTAIDACDFDNMKKSNDLYRQHAPMRTYDFVREGKRDASMDAETREYIIRRARKVMEKIYPEYL